MWQRKITRLIWISSNYFGKKKELEPTYFKDFFFFNQVITNNSLNLRSYEKVYLPPVLHVCMVLLHVTSPVDSDCQSSLYLEYCHHCSRRERKVVDDTLVLKVCAPNFFTVYQPLCHSWEQQGQGAVCQWKRCPNKGTEWKRIRIQVHSMLRISVFTLRAVDGWSLRKRFVFNK